MWDPWNMEGQLQWDVDRVCSKNLDFEKHSKSQPANFKGPVLAYKNSDPCDYGVMTEIKNAHFKRKCH